MLLHSEVGYIKKLLYIMYEVKIFEISYLFKLLHFIREYPMLSKQMVSRISGRIFFRTYCGKESNKILEVGT